MYLKLKNIISDALCKELIEIYKSQNTVGKINKKVFEFRTNWNQGVDNKVKNFLDTTIVPLAKNQWQFRNYEYTNIKIREYPTGSFYEQHVDFYHPQPSKIYLSFSIVLNDAFQGGEFVLKSDQKFDIKKNDGIVFEGTDVHEVLKITSGYRMSLIGHLIADRK